jgi:flagellar biosynthesis/type III secretory pathway protein FliH
MGKRRSDMTPEELQAIREYRRKWYAENRDKAHASWNKWKETHAKSYAQYQKHWRDTHKAERKEKGKQWREANAGYSKGYRAGFKAGFKAAIEGKQCTQ